MSNPVKLNNRSNMLYFIIIFLLLFYDSRPIGIDRYVKEKTTAHYCSLCWFTLSCFTSDLRGYLMNFLRELFNGDGDEIVFFIIAFLFLFNGNRSEENSRKDGDADEKA